MSIASVIAVGFDPAVAMGGRGEGDRRARELLDALPAAIYTTDSAGRVTYYNEAAVALSGRRPRLGADRWCVTWRLFSPDGAPLPHDECPMAICLKENRPVRGQEAIAERPDGSRVAFLPYPTPLHDEDGRLIGAVNMLVDITPRKEAEDRQRLLFAEMNHRIKNNMQRLHALLIASARETESLEARAVLSAAVQRVASMAAAQTVLYRTESAGCYRADDFLAAVCGGIECLSAPGVNIDRAADPLELPNDTAVPLALILNELLINAVQHAADDRGRVRINVRLTAEGRGAVLGVEDDGPGFALNPSARRSSGLGLVTGLAAQIGATFQVDARPGGHCLVRMNDLSSAGR